MDIYLYICIVEMAKLVSVAKLIFYTMLMALMYGKCSKILNTSCLPKRPRQKGQTQIRVFPVCYSDKPFVNSSPD